MTRGLLALTVIVSLLPVLAVTAPQVFDELWPWGSGSSPDTALLATAEETDGASKEPRLDLPCSPPTCSLDAAPRATLASRQDEPVPSSAASHSIQDTTSTTTGAETTTSTTDTTDTTESSTPTKETTNTSKPSTEGIITGNACPCTITGTASLEGSISLQGDLVVKGGTLVARPGVDLDGNGYEIMFTDGGRADFQGTKVSTWSDRGSKANLERDVNFRNLRRIMWMGGGGPSIVKYVAVTDSGTSKVGDYPLHWHLNGNSTRGTVVEGVVVVNGKHHAFVPHGSHGITFKDVIAKSTKGDAFWWDPPGTNESCAFQKFCTIDNSNDIKVDHALVHGVSNGPGDSRGFSLSGFVLGAGSGNAIHNSAAININPSHVKNCSGFHWPESANQNVGGNVWGFGNNHSHSSSGCHGIFVWQNDGNNHVVKGFTGGGIDHGAYGNHYQYVNADVPYVEIHAAGWQMRDGRVDTVVAFKHVSDRKPTAIFTDVAIERFVVRNADDNGSVPGEYVFERTGLTCEDIEYPDALSGTRVVIDGTPCS